MVSARILDGKSVAKTIKAEIKETICKYTNKGEHAPALAVILVGSDPASFIYVKNKIKSCAEVGIKSISYELLDSTKEAELLKLINELNNNNDIDGILVQLPLPSHIDTKKIIECINPNKDVDGFHPYNLGRLAQGNPLLRPCTSYGIIQLLKEYNIEIKGKHVVVVGASNIVGRPMSFELLIERATVTTCHRATINLEKHIRTADIIIIAAGRYDIVKTNWLQKHQVIVDIGIHRRDDGVLHGDIDFLKAKERVSWITPVPGGAGPMTICTLMQNTLQAAYGQFI